MNAARRWHRIKSRYRYRVVAGLLVVADRSWFHTVLGGRPVLTTMSNEHGDLRWIVAAPIVGRTGRSEGIVAGDLDETRLAEVLNPELQLGNGAEVAAVDQDHRLVYDTSM